MCLFLLSSHLPSAHLLSVCVSQLTAKDALLSELRVKLQTQQHESESMADKQREKDRERVDESRLKQMQADMARKDQVIKDYKNKVCHDSSIVGVTKEQQMGYRHCQVAFLGHCGKNFRVNVSYRNTHVHSLVYISSCCMSSLPWLNNIVSSAFLLLCV